MQGIQLRDAYYSEIPAIARMSTLAFWDDDLFAILIHPHREKYPGDADLYWIRRARVNFWDYRRKWLVAVDKDEKGTDTIVGVAQWERLGPGGKRMDCHWLDPRNLLKPLSRLAMFLHAWSWPNRACDPAQEDAIERSYPYFEKAWTGDRAESWYLELLAVHPDHQGRGIGRKLVQWGLDRAQEERVCASVVSAWGKDGFYQKAGFNVQSGCATSGEGNPLANVRGGNIFWKDLEPTNTTVG
ncbi:hypothetical protein JX266_012311 [Neoarthrinium moseri]|nr:hypothetical protein JX266_012311 [Neoarthrinium moseri]